VTVPGEDEYAPVAELYDHVVAYRERPDVDFFVEAAREAGSPVLELGCGTGRVLIPTARAGIDIVGLDSSPSMLAECRRRLAEETEPVRSRVDLVQADMRRFDRSSISSRWKNSSPVLQVFRGTWRPADC
jgi:ubiquinone/menaquinone biosynthesis C-methylase UbiE